MSDIFDLRYWLRLSFISGLGNNYLNRLLKYFESPGAACNASLSALQQVVPSKVAQAIVGQNTDKQVTDAMRWQEQQFCNILTLGVPDYPPLLLEIASPPPLLYCRGNLALLNDTLIAIVGSRNASSAGIHNTKIFSQSLSENGITIISGLAQGIDAAAHRGALAGNSKTIAVIGTGIDKRYPRSNSILYDEIIEKGLIISEFSLGTQPLPHHFPCRNRIISGLSRACLVMEATLKSGSLSTAAHAIEQGREVFAVPGSINSPLHQGCHRLIRQGAVLTENVHDIYNTLNIENKKQSHSSYQEDKISETIVVEGRLLSFINYEPTSVDDIALKTGIAMNILLPEILNLEMSGKVVAVSGGRYQRV